MTAFAVVAGVLTIQTVQEIVDEIAAKQKSDVDPLINTNPDALAGETIGVFASQEREVQEVAQILADAIDPDNAEGPQQDVIGSLRGIPRQGATKSSFKGMRKLTLNVAAGKLIPAGTVFSVLGTPTARFVQLEDADNSGGGIALNMRIAAECEVTGPVHANAGTLSVVATPVSGLNSVTNTLDPVLGKDVESDADYHARQEKELALAGSSTTEAVRSAVLQVTPGDDVFPVLDAFVIENEGDVAAFGVPSKSFEVVIWDGSGGDAVDADVAAAIFANKAGGIKAHGQTLVTLTDSYGVAKVVGFTRAQQRATTIVIVLQYDADTYVGDAAVKSIVADGFSGVKPAGAPASLKVGQRPSQDVSFGPYFALAQIAGGVVRVESIAMALDGGPPVAWTDLAIGLREIGVTDTSLITVTATPI